ncbi:MAG: ribosome assembly cofactor RimP [Paludibacteraceae bacterium]|nr:ribosome assembly cofactor RimP [Paludibacteraceae bacterium]
MIDKSIVSQLVTEFLEGKDCFLVDVTVQPGNFIVVEIDSEVGVDIDTCCAISRHIEDNLDRDVEDYELEVGSTGLTAPFKVLRQYQKNVGNEVEVLAGGKKMVGVLLQANQENFTIQVAKKIKGQKQPVLEEIVLTYPEVKYTKYNFKFN